MPCYQSTNLPSGVTATGRTSYATEAECNQACKEGACCEGTTCTVKPQCQCQGTGQVFKGVGTVCSPNPCCECQALVMVQVKLAALLGGSTVTRYGCNGTILADSTQVSWSCSASGCTLSVQNLYSTRFDGICNVNYPSVVGIGKSFSPVVVPLLSSGPCVGVAAVGWPAATTFSRQDFSVLTDIPAFYASVPDHCWGYGRPPSSDPVFPQSIYIGPANPLP
jgi:hypothetical protein